MTIDLLIIGGGINGCAIAREAALNGLSVMLVEKDDLASHTSSASTKLIHGGLRYLEYYEFKLVREALKERELLLKAAPHIIRPMRFVLPHENAVRPWWMVRIGLYLYDWIGGKISLPRSRGLSPNDTAFNAPLQRPGKGFIYSDCRVDDSRLTLFNAMDAANNGAEIATRTELLSARRENGLWNASLSDGRTISARALVNAAGPWVASALTRLGSNSRSHVRLIKGSHIVVPSLFAGDHAYMLQQKDGRIVFAIPYQDGFTMIGTTDIAVERPEDAQISDDEIAYLIAASNLYFMRQISPADVVNTWSGVRPLYDDGASESKAVTRDYVLELDTTGTPLLSVFGGKITTARHLAEEALEKLGATIGLVPNPVTRARIFPGGAIASLRQFEAEVNARWPFLGEARAARMAGSYGFLLHEMLVDMTDEHAMGRDFGAGFTEIEARWMREREWAKSPEDCLMRRSKLGLRMTMEEQSAFAAWWAKQAT